MPLSLRYYKERYCPSQSFPPTHKEDARQAAGYPPLTTSIVGLHYNLCSFRFTLSQKAGRLGLAARLSFQYSFCPAFPFQRSIVKKNDWTSLNDLLKLWLILMGKTRVILTFETFTYLGRTALLAFAVRLYFPFMLCVLPNKIDSSPGAGWFERTTWHSFSLKKNFKPISIVIVFQYKKFSFLLIFFEGFSIPPFVHNPGKADHRFRSKSTTDSDQIVQ